MELRILESRLEFDAPIKLIRCLKSYYFQMVSENCFVFYILKSRFLAQIFFICILTKWRIKMILTNLTFMKRSLAFVYIDTVGSFYKKVCEIIFQVCSHKKWTLVHQKSKRAIFVLYNSKGAYHKKDQVLYRVVWCVFLRKFKGCTKLS